MWRHMGVAASQIIGNSTVSSTSFASATNKLKNRITLPLWGDSTSDRWIPLTKGHWYGMRVNFVTSSLSETHLKLKLRKFLSPHTTQYQNVVCSCADPSQVLHIVWRYDWRALCKGYESYIYEKKLLANYFDRFQFPTDFWWIIFVAMAHRVISVLRWNGQVFGQWN